MIIIIIITIEEVIEEITTKMEVITIITTSMLG